MIPKNFFDLTEEQISFSKTLYNGKIIKCLIAPHHTYAQLEKVIPFTKSTYLFPEREMTSGQLPQFINLLVNSQITDEILIITAATYIILDMINDNVRILTEDGEILPCPIKTFQANIHSIKYEILDNEIYRTSKIGKSTSIDNVQKLIDDLNSLNGKTITQKEKDELSKKIDLIGEDVISGTLSSMLSRISVKKENIIDIKKEYYDEIVKYCDKTFSKDNKEAIENMVQLFKLYIKKAKNEDAAFMEFEDKNLK